METDEFRPLMRNLSPYKYFPAPDYHDTPTTMTGKQWYRKAKKEGKIAQDSSLRAGSITDVAVYKYVEHIASKKEWKQWALDNPLDLDAADMSSVALDGLDVIDSDDAMVVNTAEADDPVQIAHVQISKGKEFLEFARKATAEEWVEAKKLTAAKWDLDTYLGAQKLATEEEWVDWKTLWPAALRQKAASMVTCPADDMDKIGRASCRERVLLMV